MLRPSSLSAALLGLGAFAMVAAASQAEAVEPRAMLDVAVDHAEVLRLPRPAETVIIGNPAIVDATVHDSRTLVLTGKSYGITNLVVLDAGGEAILDGRVAVRSFEAGTVRVYRQAERATYACSPECEPTVTIGDNAEAFADAASQYGTRQSMAAEAAQ